MKDEYEKLIDVLRKKDNFLITSHIDPDGDMIGSELALAILLKQMKKKCVILNDHSTPNKFNFLPYSGIIQNKIIQKKYQVALILDCSNLERVGNVFNLCKKIKIKVNIDHHITNTNFGEINLAKESACATAEKIYNLILKLGYKIDKDIAICLYTGIVTDTNLFRYSNTSSHTHQIVSNLLKLGISPEKISQEIYENKTFEELKLLSEVLSSLKLNKDKKIAWISLKKIKKGDYEGFINFPFSIQGIEVAIFFKKLSSNKIKVTFRSAKNVDVAKIALLFNGGGHNKASGCVISGELNTVIKKVISEVEKKLK